MKRIADYDGPLLSHVEALYRPGERELAVELATALGCVITDTGFEGEPGEGTFLAVHPNPDDRNVQNNVFYISQMTAEQQAVEARLHALGAADPELADLLAGYRGKARSRPFGVPHFALRYPDPAAVATAMENLERLLAPRLGERMHLRVFHPGDADGAGDDVVQGFVHQDVIVSGAFLFGQLIELQTQARA